MPRQALGRGLSPCVGDDKLPPMGSNPIVNELDIDLIQPNPEQPRTRFTESALDELAQSIASNGVVQPILVRRKGERYEIVAGERRWRAAQAAGLASVPVSVREGPDEALLARAR